MRVVFMGTPDFADASLKKLIEEGFEIAGVFTQPDRSRGRGMTVRFSPVKERALAAQIPVYQLESLRDAAVLELLRDLKRSQHQPDRAERPSHHRTWSCCG